MEPYPTERPVQTVLDVDRSRGWAHHGGAYTSEGLLLFVETNAGLFEIFVPVIVGDDGVPQQTTTEVDPYERQAAA